MLFPQTNKSEVISEFEKNCVKIFPFSHCLLNDNEASDNTEHKKLLITSDQWSFVVVVICCWVWNRNALTSFWKMNFLRENRDLKEVSEDITDYLAPGIHVVPHYWTRAHNLEVIIYCCSVTRYRRDTNTEGWLPEVISCEQNALKCNRCC